MSGKASWRSRPRSNKPRKSASPTPMCALAAGRALDRDAVRLAVVASVRHVDTDYDALLMSGVDRESARAHVHQRVEDVVNAWRDGVAMLNE